jgi:small-conductance mechanosensitive channel
MSESPTGEQPDSVLPAPESRAAAEAAKAKAAEAEAAEVEAAAVEAELGGGRVHQIEPDEHSPLAALANVISADFRRTLFASVLALAGLGLTYISGGVLGNNGARIDFFAKHSGLGQIAAIVGAVFFLFFGVIAVRTATTEILKTVPQALGDNRRNGLRWVCLLVGYLVVIFGTLGALNVPIERLVVGGAVTGVILGIAAQQSLGNLFAGLMLLLTRPFAIGDEVSLRSGPLGGVLTGLIADMNLTYVKMVTDQGTILLPNSTVLTAVVGPPGVFDVGMK